MPIISPEHSFIHFSDGIESCDCSTTLDVGSPSNYNFGCYIYIPYSTLIFLCDTSGSVLLSPPFQTTPGDSTFIHITASYLDEYITSGDCFRIMVRDNRDTIEYYSNILRYTGCNKANSYVRYYSKNTAYFPFANNWPCAIYLPFNLQDKNAKTQKEEYVDANGKIRNPYKQLRHEYLLETDYVDDQFHEKMQVMLLHEEISINGMLINETGSYKINYSDYIIEGGKRLHKATTEISSQQILLMRNY